jgi:hypothetical protein
MGADFIRRAAPSFRKGLDRGRVELGTPHFFTQEPAAEARSYAAHFVDGKSATEGEQLGVHLEGQCVFVLRGLDVIAAIDEPPPELVAGLAGSFGEACAIVVQVHDLAHVAEVIVC